MVQRFSTFITHLTAVIIMTCCTGIPRYGGTPIFTPVARLLGSKSSKQGLLDLISLRGLAVRSLQSFLRAAHAYAGAQMSR